jgi:uncharacterized membrane protein YvlD (DUF360 family)
MVEFVGRWGLVGIFADVCLVVAGARSWGWWTWVLAAMWIGFWNALVRPGVLRLGLSGAFVYWALFLAMSVINGVLFLGSSTWISWGALPGRRGLLWVAVCVATVSWAVSSRFRCHDGRWHWIGHHGQIRRKGARH